MYRLAIDVGGTFTDLIVASDDGQLVEAKVPSNKEEPAVALKAGLDDIASRLNYQDVRDFLSKTQLIIHGTTVAINAVVQTNGALTGLVCTKGFRDSLEIRLGYKEERHDLSYRPPPPLVPRHLRIPVSERIDKNGRVISPLAVEEVEAAAATFNSAGVEAVAICLLWSFLNPDHERQVEDIMKASMPDVFVTRSSEVLPKIREYNRASTTVLNAYVGPIVAKYITSTETLLRRLGFAGRIRYIQSNGGLAESGEVMRRPVLLLISGPAAAPAAALHFKELAGDNIIAIDMGGTSFDTCLVRSGLPDMRSATDVHGYRVETPLVDVHAIGAGGGSIVRLEAGILSVGPQSAEADPGPACYGRGGKWATVTDANVVLGVLNQRELLGGRFPIDASLAERAIGRQLADRARMSSEEAAAGIVEIVTRNMADAIREITIRRGYDPREFSIVAGGGAGGLHAAHLAEELAVKKIIVPKIASTFCAFGALVANLRHDYTRSFVSRWREVNLRGLKHAFQEFESLGKLALEEEGVKESRMDFLRSLDIRYVHQVYECTVDVTDIELDGEDEDTLAQIEERFHKRHEELYDFSQPDYSCELVSLTVAAIGDSPGVPLSHQTNKGVETSSLSRRRARLSRSTPAKHLPVFPGDVFEVGKSIDGPAIIEEWNTTVVVPFGWRATLEKDAYVLKVDEEIRGE